MKKIVVILLLIIYSAATMGAIIHMHYCMNKYVGWSFGFVKKDKKCGKCGMKEKKGGCCKDEHKQIKLKTEHQKSATVQSVPFSNTVAFAGTTINYSFKALFISKNLPVFNAPPKIPKERLYILHGVYLI